MLQSIPLVDILPIPAHINLHCKTCNPQLEDQLYDLKDQLFKIALQTKAKVIGKRNIYDKLMS